MECPICKEDIKENATVCIRCRHCIKGHPLKKFLYNYIKRLTFGMAFVALIVNGVLGILTYIFKK